jgi:CheY-like chemotaxis protein
MQELLDRSLRGDVEVAIAVEETWPVEVDPGELELAVLNLCVNARDAMPTGGRIEIVVKNDVSTSGSVRGDVVRLSISDTGLGMSKEVIPHVFEPFFTTKEVGKGSGLGLAQVYAFVSQSGGRVGIDSVLGLGTTVTLTFPRSDKALSRSPSLDAGRPLDPPDPDAPPIGRVLLVEDDAEVATLTKELLDSIGYAVTHVSSADAALGTLADDRAIDIVFSDVMMPGPMNGVELAREIRRRRPGLPVVLATGYLEAARAAVDEGLQVLTKPYRLDALARALNVCVEKR